MSRGALVQLKHRPWPGPGMIIREPYGVVLTHESHHSGKVKYSQETKVVDVLVGMHVLEKIPLENLIRLV